MLVHSGHAQSLVTVVEKIDEYLEIIGTKNEKEGMEERNGRRNRKRKYNEQTRYQIPQKRTWQEDTNKTARTILTNW
jgi:nicotinamide mononucleotide adenylyltransferase